MVTGSAIKRAVEGLPPERVSAIARVLDDTAASCIRKIDVTNEASHSCYLNVFACGGYCVSHIFSKNTYFIGRSKEMNLVVSADNDISRLHAVLNVHGDGSATIRDAASAQGLFINGQRVYRHELKDGDIITIGSYTLHFHSLVPPKQQAEAEEVAKESGSKISLLPVAVETTVAMMIVDRSGSMGRFGEAPKNAINAYIKSLRATGENFFCGVTSFADTACVEIPLAAVSEIEKFDGYHANGNTLLYATVQEALKECLALKQQMKVDNRPLRVIIGVFSDGQDNQSPAGCQEDLKIASTQATEAGFELLTFGIGIDGKDLADNLGFPSDLAETVEATEEGVERASQIMTRTSIIRSIPKA